MCLSEDHKPGREDEAKRIRDAGGFVINGRVMGELAVSRAFGDVDFKKGLQVGACVLLSTYSFLLGFFVAAVKCLHFFFFISATDKIL